MLPNLLIYDSLCSMCVDSGVGVGLGVGVGVGVDDLLCCLTYLYLTPSVACLIHT